LAPLGAPTFSLIFSKTLTDTGFLVKKLLVLCAAVAAVVLAIAGFPADASSTSVPTDSTAGSTAAAPDLDALARKYRIQVYQTFHADRNEFDRRRAFWRELYTQWIKQGQDRDEAVRLAEWLEAATYASRAQSRGPLPQWNKSWNKSWSDSITPRSRIETSPHPSDIISPPVAPLSRRRPAIAPIERTTPALPELPRVAIRALVDQPRRPKIDSAAIAVADRQSRTPPAIRIPQVAAPSHALSHATVDDLPKQGSNEAPPKKRQPKTTRPKSVVNVEELRARVTGHNVSVAELEELLREESGWSVERVASRLDMLSERCERFRFLRTYVALVSAEDRATLRRLMSPREVITAMAGRIVDVRLQLMNGASQGGALRKAQLDRLDRFSRHLAELAASIR
jgi:hypothetical protein